MPELIFKHDAVLKDGKPWTLHLAVGPNDIEWGYGLNTVTYPTYGGQVIQILSVYIDDITITGNVKGYKSMETIYRWFARYMAAATAGDSGPKQNNADGTVSAYNQVPVVMQYPHRGWEFKIYPKTLPGFVYGTDVVAPLWTITAAIAQRNEELEKAILSSAKFDQIATENEFNPSDKKSRTQGQDLLAQLTKGLTPKLTFKDGVINTGVFSDPDADPAKTVAALKGAGDYFHSLVDVYLSGKIPYLSDQADASKPYLDGKGTGNLDPSAVTKKKKKTPKKTGGNK